ncbi:MAG: hypothetical protein JXR97_11860 [Planctomycetes bacterium]|nr:hypothetical protein [Planctomycetota bacterium]
MSVNEQINSGIGNGQDGETFSFRGRTTADAMQKVVQKLGKDAFIIEKKQVRGSKGKGGLLGGLLGGDDEFVEIIASSALPAPKQEQPKAKVSLLQKTYCNLPPREEFAPRPSASSADELPSIEKAGRGLAAQLDEIKNALQKQMSSELEAFVAMQARGGMPAVSDALLAEYRGMIENDVAADVARQLVENLNREIPGAKAASKDAVREALCEAVSRTIDAAGPITLKEEGPTVVAMVGPTGVGKTTTMAKIAVEFVYKRNLRVGIINEDVRRPGAEAQLRNLSQLLGVPVHAAEGPERGAEALRQMSDMDLVLIDTAGRVPSDKASLDELALFLRAVGADEVHLVISGDCSPRSALQTAEKFERIEYNRLIFSKLDEAASYGLILNVAAQVNKKMSYVTSGREYMESVVPAEGGSLAKLICDGRDETANGGRGRPW